MPRTIIYIVQYACVKDKLSREHVYGVGEERAYLSTVVYL